MSTMHDPVAPVAETAAILAAPRAAVVDAGSCREPAAEASAPAPARWQRRETKSQLSGVEGFAITSVIVLGGTVAMGWFDTWLPSGLVVAAVAMSALLVAGLLARTRALLNEPHPPEAATSSNLALTPPSEHAEWPAPDDGSGEPRAAGAEGRRQRQALR